MDHDQVNKLSISNPPQRSPWESKAPKGFRWRRIRLVACDKLKDSRRVLPTNHSYFREDQILLNVLNRKTLLLSFPHIPPQEIDSIMAKCNGNLSEAIKVIHSREHLFLYNSSASVTKRVNYIPTKYSDVQIVEPVDGDVKMKRDVRNQNTKRKLDATRARGDPSSTFSNSQMSFSNFLGRLL